MVYCWRDEINVNNRGNYWISNGSKRGEFLKFIPGGYKNGK